MLPLTTLIALFFALAEPLAIGALAPDFEVIPIGGAPFRLATATESHSAVVVLFFSVVCPYSKLHGEHLQELSSSYDSKEVLFIGLDSNRTETMDEVAAYARAQTYPVMKDAGNRIADLLGARVTPEAFLFDHEGRLRYHGRVQSKTRVPDLKNALDAVLAGRPVKSPEAKAYGCYITRN